MAKDTQISQHSGKPSDQILMALTQMAMSRGAQVDSPTLKLYSKKLANERLDDLLAAIELSDMPREPGEVAFFEVGAIRQMAHVMAAARLNRERAEREYLQQQQCPKCNGVVQMTRPRGEQLRTWCVNCQAYRKIYPEDMTLTDGEWALLCSAITDSFLRWRERGSIPKENVDPQHDRDLVRGMA